MQPHHDSLYFRLALVAVLLVGLILPKSASAAPTWTAVASMNIARYAHTATLLPNGKVLITGGIDASGGYLISSEVYDPSDNTWTQVASLSTNRYAHTATLLLNGKVLVVGGYNGDRVASTELYDPVATRNVSMV